MIKKSDDLLKENNNSEVNQNEFFLSNNPNPFNPVTIISFSIPKTYYVSLIVYDLLGREIAVLVNQVKEAGQYQVEFNANSLSSGVYIYKLQLGNKIITKKCNC